MIYNERPRTARMMQQDLQADGHAPLDFPTTKITTWYQQDVDDYELSTYVELLEEDGATILFTETSLDILVEDAHGVGITPLFEPVFTQLFEVSAYIVCATVGAGDAQLILTWNDGYVSHTEALTEAIDLSILGSYKSGKKVIMAAGGQTVFISVSSAGITGGAKYTAFVEVNSV